MSEVTHAQIYERLLAVEQKVDKLDKSTEAVVQAFNAASGAFTVLEWMARAVKPIPSYWCFLRSHLDCY